jgi:F0F1-type ATP synthase membrane subunit b/b'
MSKKVDQILDEAIDNIRKDRDVTQRLLDDVMIYLSKSEERHREVGITAAKYVETLQRSNEQLVKISTLLKRSEKPEAGLSADDKKDIFDLLQGNIDNE